MATFTVHQIQNKRNAPARLRFDDEYQAGDFEHYTPVMRVEASDLNEVFSLTNAWNNADAVRRLSRAHSTSVGDIIETHTGEHAFWMVSYEGFNKLEVL